MMIILNNIRSSQWVSPSLTEGVKRPERDSKDSPS
jgi:hypothetical protein